MMRVLNFFLLLSVFFFASCTSQKQTITNYLETRNDTTGKNFVNMPEPVIQKGDLLSIKVFSLSTKPDETDRPYNIPEATTSTGGTTVPGVLVDVNGNIEWPGIGTLHAEGLTRAQLAVTMEDKLKDKLTQPNVLVRFTNFKITVLGEVKSPGGYTVPTERVNILEALGYAGDITEFGSKNTVKVYREANGQYEIGKIDLSSTDMFSSPYFRLQQNDVVFVEQTGRKYKQEQQQNIAQQVGIGVSILTAIALILNFIK